MDPTGKRKNTSLTQYGCFDNHVGEFDINLFKMSPREAAQTDPMQRMMLLTAYEALESAGYYDNDDQNVRPRNGTFYGVAGDDYRQVNSGQDVDINYITGGTRAFGPGRVSYHFGWEGPSMSVDAACSASAVAINQAISSLRLKECDIALAGGANLLTCSDMFAGLSRAKFVCTTGPCKTFDETADGYCRADATATVVLKRFGDAARHKDNILGIIHSIETHHAGMAISLTHPEAETQTTLFESVLRSARIGIAEVDHVELHGTGTQAGDLAEATSVFNLLKEPRPKDRALTISSVKPNVGHSEAASGVTSLIKGLLMLQHQIIPGHIGIKTRLNPKLPDIGDLGIVIPQVNVPFRTVNSDSRRRMLINNFNATGGITAMLLEEHHPTQATLNDVRQYYPITLSAASAAALFHSQTRLLEHLISTARIEISHLSYTLTARRLHHKHRFACVASSIEDLIHKLQIELSHPSSPSKRGASAFGVFVFTGQGSSYTGMANVLFKTNNAFQSHILHSDAICRDIGLPSFLGLIADEGAEFSQYSHTQHQLSLVALEIALASLLESWGIQPKAVVGHSLGEYSALCVSQVLSLVDTLYLVGKRGLLLEAACRCREYSMAAVSLSAPEMEETLHLPRFSECEISCLNASDQTVISGPDMAIEGIMTQFKEKRVRSIKLQTPYAFHSKQMDVILSDFRQIAGSIVFKKPSIPVGSTVLGEIVQEEGVFSPHYLCRQTREPVRFQDTLYKLEGLIELGQNQIFIEVGPSPACSPMITSAIQVKTTSLVCTLDPKKANWLTMSSTVTKFYNGNGHVRWDEYHREYLDALSLLKLPSYPFDLKKYWIQYNGDWAIRKNENMPISVQAAEAAKPTLKSSTLHSLDDDHVDRGTRKLCFASNFNTGDLRSIVKQYKVNGQPSCPISVYVDMALAATSYLFMTSERGPEVPPMEVVMFEMLSDLDPFMGHFTKLVATQRPSDTNIVEISITCKSHDVATELVRSKVMIGNGEVWRTEANSASYLYQSRMDLLNLFLTNGQVSRLTQSDVYQGVSCFAHYSKTFQGIRNVLLDSGGLEAVASVILPQNEGKYCCDPLWLDILLQVPTLVMNCSQKDAIKSQYTFQGWRRMQVLLSLEPNTIYRVHVRMQLCGRTKFMTGHLHVLDEAGCAAAVIERLEFKPVLGSRLKTIPNPASRTNGIDVVNGTADIAYANGTQTPNICKADGTFPNSHRATNTFEENGDGYDGVSEAHSRRMPTVKVTHGIDDGDLIEERSCKTPRVNGAIHSKATNKPPLPISSSPELIPELQRVGKVLHGDRSGAVDFGTVLDILAEETGVELGSLDDDVLFDDLGIDSIIQISLIARFREYLGKPLPASLLVERNSIVKLRHYFATQ